MMRELLKRARFPAAVLFIAGLAMPVLASFFTRTHWTVDLVALVLKPSVIGLGLFGIGLAALTIFRRAGKPVAILAAIALAAGILGAFQVGGASRALTPEQQTRALTVYQHNVWAGNLDGAAIAAQIRAADPDVAVMIETSRYYGTGEDFDALSDTWPYQLKDEPRPARQARLRIMSKYPLSETRITRDETGLSIAAARIDGPFGPVTLMGLHFTRPWPFDWPRKQVEQLDAAMAELDARACPCIVVGDFNSPPWGRLARTLEARLPFHHLQLGWKGTWNEKVPGWLAIPIDLSFASDELQFGSARTLPPSGSDHKAVLFEIAPSQDGLEY